MLDAQHKYFRKYTGFTLIELSIVLVIIGLVIGGVLVGQDLIKSSGNRAFISQLETYNSVVNTFKNKYNCLPGDCVSAAAFGFTGNGGGNGVVSGLITDGFVSSDYTIDPAATFTSVYLSNANNEIGKFWSHLRSALLIPDYMVTLVVSDGVGAGYSLPPAKNDGTGVIVAAWRGKHYFRSGVGGTRGGGNVLWSLNFSPADAAYVFQKMGGTTISTTNSYGSVYPDGLGKERVLISNATASYGTIWSTDFFLFQTHGTGGATANYCIDDSATPAYFNLKNPSKLCALIIQASF